MKRIYIYFIVLALTACATPQQKPIYPSINNFVGSSDFIKYKKIAVLPFSDAPNAHGSGQIVQGLAGQIFAKWGFEVVERARLADILTEQKLSLYGVLDTPRSIELGKILGVKAIVVGEVGQYETQKRKTDTTYFPWTNIYTGKTSYYPIQGRQWAESYVSISFRVLDVRTGQLIYSGSGQYNQGLGNPPQQLAEHILFAIIRKWCIPPGACGFKINKDKIVKMIIKDSPAEQAGLKIGDKIIKINGESISNYSALEYKKALWGNPGDRKTLNIQRNGNILSIQIIMDDRQKVYKK